MPRPRQTREQLICEVVALRQRITQLEAVVEALQHTAAEAAQGQTGQSGGLQDLHIINTFNNVLTVMLGYAELTLRAVPQDSAAWSWLQHVLKAGEQAKKLVRELHALNRHAK